ncbi:MAG: DUF6629 family protein [Pseudonocardia sp.]
MCFSATANFVGGTVVTGIGIATLAQVRHPREVPLAALPALFGLHQFTEAFVWLGLEGHIPRSVGDAAAYLYLLYAQGVLPVLFPLALLLIEPSTRRRWIITPFVILGAACGNYLFWIDAGHPVSYRIMNNSIAYHNSGSLVSVFAVVYVIAVCGGALASGYRWIVVFGIANLIGLTTVEILLATSFTSVWCAYAAVVSVVLLIFFRRQQRHNPFAAREPRPTPRALHE